MTPTAVLRSPQGVLVESDGLLASYWVSAWEYETTQQFQQVFRDVRARQPKGVGTLMVFRTSAIDARTFGHEPTRKMLAKLHDEFLGYFRPTALVLEGTGFVAAALRSSTWAMSQVLRSPQMPKYFDSVEEAARHQATQLADLGATRDSIVKAAQLAKLECLASVSTPDKLG
jgi:hypothetical protein